VRQQKTGAVIEVPLHRDLHAVQEKARHNQRGLASLADRANSHYDGLWLSLCAELPNDSQRPRLCVDLASGGESANASAGLRRARSHSVYDLHSAYTRGFSQ
jgi:hypothetical protein